MRMFFKKKTNTLQPVVAANLFTVTKPTAIQTEQVKTIRTNLAFSQEAQNLQTIMITSTKASEGKSTVAANLAVEFAKSGKKTILIDADLRRSTVHKTFGIYDSTVGLTNYLVHRYDTIEDAIVATQVENLDIIPAGPTPPNPAELIGSPQMKDALNALKDKYDLVIVDAPPLLPVTDGQIMATITDGVVMVVRQNNTEKQAVSDAVKLLKGVKANILGVILNDVQEKGSGYYGYGEGYYYNDSAK